MGARFTGSDNEYAEAVNGSASSHMGTPTSWKGYALTLTADRQLSENAADLTVTPNNRRLMRTDTCHFKSPQGPFIPRSGTFTPFCFRAIQLSRIPLS